MSKKELPLVSTPPGCCAPLAREPLTEQDARDLAASFKALADPVRLRLLSLIASFAGGEACVCDLTDPFEVSQPTISHHLKVLREAGLIESERRGTWVYYRAVPDAFARLGAVLAIDVTEVTDKAPAYSRLTRVAVVVNTASRSASLRPEVSWTAAS